MGRFLLMLALGLSFPAARAEDLDDWVSEIPFEQLFGQLPIQEKVEEFLKGKRFVSVCTKTQPPAGYDSSVPFNPKFPTYRFLYDFDAEQKQVVHRFVTYFGNESCEGTCETEGNVCDHIDYVASYGTLGQLSEDTYQVVWRPDMHMEADLIKVDFAKGSFQLGDRQSEDADGFPTLPDPKREFTVQP